MNVLWALFEATLHSATPLLFATLGELCRQKAGVLNIGLEGEMLAGAFAAVLVAHMTGSPWWGLAGAAAAGGMVGVLFSYWVFRLKSNSIVVGAAINILMLGVTSSGLRLFLNSGNQVTGVTGLPSLGPFVITTYAALALIPVTSYILMKTRIGLITRAAGHHPRAVHSTGVNVNRLRLGWTVAGAALVGIGGASLSIGYLNTFTDNMTAGRGFVALSAVFFGNWVPLQAALGSMVFALIDALQLQIQIARLGIPSDFLIMLPYAATVIILALMTRRAGTPKTLGENFEEEK